ncbi:hypothetical protein V6N13_129455 [Hibiscus sabdariffa]
MNTRYSFQPDLLCDSSSAVSYSSEPPEGEDRTAAAGSRNRSLRAALSSLLIRLVIRMSRARWFTFLRRVFHYQNGSRSDLGSNPFNSNTWMMLEFLALVIQIIITTFTLTISKNEKPVWPMRIWIVGYDIGCALSLLLLYGRYRHLHITQGDGFGLSDVEQQRTNEESRCSHLMNKCRTSLELFFAIWFVMGNVWVFDSRFGSFHRAPNLHVLCISLLAWNALCYSFPFLLFLLLCCCVPLISSLLGYNMNMGSTDRGASDDQISSLPSWRYKAITTNTELEHDSDCNPSRENEDDAECCICLAKYKDKEEVRQLPCSHMFHLKPVGKSPTKKAQPLPFFLPTPTVPTLSKLFSASFSFISTTPPSPSPSPPYLSLQFSFCSSFIGREISDPKPKFLEVYTVLKAELLDDPAFEFADDSRQWVERMLDYNVPGGKLNRGLSVVDSYRLLKHGKELSDDELFLACTLGWCIEWLQAYFIVLDDIMDDSHTRRGKPCWFRLPQIGLIAVNDGLILHNQIFRILKNHFRGKPYYVDLLDLFNEVEFQTASGQMIDLITTLQGEKDLSKYSLPIHRRIVQYKTAYYSFYLPVACALLMAGENLDNHTDVKNVLVEMGTYFQVQDDFLDCFGDPEVIGKVGTDIENFKCSWLVVKALDRANEDQKKLLFENYGKPDAACVAKVKELYQTLDIQGAFAEYESKSYEKITKQIEGHPSKAVKAVLKSFLAKIYKRQK